MRRDVVGGAEQASWPLAGAQPTAVAFADLVGFTRLGERVPGEELAKLSARLSAAGRQVARPPVRFVKTIGDAVMLVSPQPSPLVGAMLTLVDSVEADEELPSLRVGIAYGRRSLGRLVRAARERRQPDHGPRPARNRARHEGRARRDRRGLRVVARGLAQLQEHQRTDLTAQAPL